MSITKLQDVVQDVVNPVEIDAACEAIRQALKNGLDWVTHPYHIAQRFYRKQNERVFYYPETYVKTDSGKAYHRLTPDNDYKGMFFFMVGTGISSEFSAQGEGFMTYPVSIIYSVNLPKVDPVRFEAEGMFTQALIRDARRILAKSLLGFDFTYTITGETRDLRECYREFVLDDMEAYNRMPMQCFRHDLEVVIQETCEAED